MSENFISHCVKLFFLSKLTIVFNFFFRTLSKKSALHIAEQCLSHFGVGYIYPLNSVYGTILNQAILEYAASGLDKKIQNEMSWELLRDSASLLEQSRSASFSFADVEERKLNLADTEGMFLLMAVGYIIAGSVLVSEIVGGCAQKCRQIVRRRSCTLYNMSSKFGKPSSSTSLVDEPEEQKTFTMKIAAKLLTRFQRRPSEPDANEPGGRRASVAAKSKHKRTFSLGGNEEEFKQTITSGTVEEIENDEQISGEELENTVEYELDEETSVVFYKNHIDHVIIENEKEDERSNTVIAVESEISMPNVVQEEHVVDINQVDSNTNSVSGEFGEKINHPDNKK